MNQTTQKLQQKQITDVASQPSPPEGLQFQSSGNAREQFRKKSWNEQVPFLDSYNTCPTDNRESRKQRMTTSDGDSNVSPLTSTAPYIEELLEMNRQTNCISR